jgi:hypothetical protein
MPDTAPLPYLTALPAAPPARLLSQARALPRPRVALVNAGAGLSL